MFVSIHIVGIYVITFLIIVVPLEEKHIVRNARLYAECYPFIIFNTPIPEEPLLYDHNRERLCSGSETNVNTNLKENLWHGQGDCDDDPADHSQEILLKVLVLALHQGPPFPLHL